MSTPPALDRVHFVGVGGAGMSGIARILLARGAQVSGSDAKESTALAALRVLGADVYVGHAGEQIAGADVVVTSSAIREDNPEVLAAKAAGVTVLPRAAALAALMRGRTGVAVAGTHGKTTTTSMLVVALQSCHADPSFAIGGDLNEAGSNAHEGTGEIFVAEADESDGSFLLLAPHAAVVTNVDVDHLDHYGSLTAVRAAFAAFAAGIDDDGFLVTCADDPGAQALAADVRARGRDVRTYGESDGATLQLADLQIHADRTTFTAVHDGVTLDTVRLAVVGRHNALDAAAALLTGLGLGYALPDLLAGLATFGGARRRFERKGAARGVRVIDDYAHNPAKVAAALAAARVVAGAGRVHAVFQPHLYSRTQHFAAAFGAALGAADDVVVLEVYGAREDPVPGISGQLIADAVPLPAGQVAFVPDASEAVRRVAGRAQPGDLVLTIGAGDVTMLGPQILDLLAGVTLP